MTPCRQRETTQVEITALKALINVTPDDPLAKPMLLEQLTELEASLAALDQRPPLNPETEIFFTGGPTVGARGLEITFTSHILDSYQNMLTNHYSAKHYGTLRRSGRRRGEADTKLYLTALPRGSFGLQLAQPHVDDFVAAGNLSQVMHEVSGLLEASAKSDAAFDESLGTFNPRVLKPLQRFIGTLFNGNAGCRVLTGFNETKLSSHQIEEAYVRVTAATEREETLDLRGVFGGVLTLSWEFDFKPEQGDIIRGAISEDVEESVATEWAHSYTHTETIATLRVVTVSTRTGKKRPTYELVSLKPFGRLPARSANKPSEPPAQGHHRKFSFD
jgi:hypothetical protein